MTIRSSWTLLSVFAAASLLLASPLFADNHAADEAEATPMADNTPTEPATQSEATEQAQAPETAMTSAVPTKYSCSLNSLVRRVEIVYATDTTVPCDVKYYKDSEAPGEVNTMWSAQNLEGYCEQKAAEFVEKLQSWGWACKGE